MDDAAQRSLLLWIQSFQNLLDSNVFIGSLSDLSDGVFLAKIMHHVDPEFLNMDLIHTDAATSWALRASNLKLLLRSIELFYHEELGQVCDTSELVDATRIAKENDPQETAKLAELILGCAVQCPSKSEYIHPIMQMDASEQASMMHMIENIMRRFHLASPTNGANGSRASDSSHSNSFAYINHEGESPESLQFQLTQALEKASMMEMKVLDMEREKREVTERFENMMVDKQSLADRYAALEDERDKLISERQSTLTRDNKKIQQIVDGEIHALTLQLEEKNEQLQRVKRESNERLIVLENEVRRQADELDIARSKLGQLAKLETSVSKYKKRLEEMTALRNQVKELETHNAQYLDKVLDLESTIKTMPALKALVERYKNQVVELETANVEAESHNQIKDQKIRRLQEELDSALGGKEFLEYQAEELRAQVNSLQQHQSQENTTMADVGLSADVLLGHDSMGQMKEKIARLERENAELKSGSENPEQSHLANELDLALKAKESLQVSLFQIKKQNEQLQEELQTARTQQHETAVAAAQAAAMGSAGVNAANGPFPAASFAAGSAGGVSESAASSMIESSTASTFSASLLHPNGSHGLTSAHVASYEERIERLTQEAEAVDSMRVTVTELTNRLKEKESVINELSEQRSKLENYTKKTLHAVQTKYMVAVSSHRNQINERQERIDFLEKKTKEIRATYSREQALMMSAFYEIGTEMQRRTMMPHAQGPTGGSAAWLASKRTEERAKRRNL